MVCHDNMIESHENIFTLPLFPLLLYCTINHKNHGKKDCIGYRRDERNRRSLRQEVRRGRIRPYPYRAQRGEVERGLALGLDKEYEGDMDDWEAMIDTNIKGLLTMTRLIVPGMVERNRGHVINIGSVAGDAAYAGGNVYCATKSAVKAITDGLRIDVAHTAVRVTNVKPGLVETNFSVVRFHGDQERADNVYKGIRPLTGDDIADVAFYAASAPAHVQIAEVLVLATHQANGTVIDRNHG